MGEQNMDEKCFSYEFGKESEQNVTRRLELVLIKSVEDRTKNEKRSLSDLIPFGSFHVRLM